SERGARRRRWTDRADVAGRRADAPRANEEEESLAALDPDVRARDDQVPRRLARPTDRRAYRREAHRASPADQGARREADRHEPGEREGRAAREPRDRPRFCVVAIAQQEA